MLATAGELPAGPGWSFEFKWDGVRALAVVGRTGVHWFARSGAEITKAYPELAGVRAALAAVGLTEAVLDGEIVVLDASGRPSFTALAERMHVRELGRARSLAATLPVSFMVFDLLSANGSDIRDVPYVERRTLLESIASRLGESGRFVVPPRFADGPATVAAARELHLEGVVAKRLQSTYRPGVRSPDWVKLKHEKTAEYVVGGWRTGRRTLGALLVGVPGPDGRLTYRGRVGGGISDAVERDLLARLATLRTAHSPFADEVPREDLKGASYVDPVLVVEVRYGNLTPDGRLRFPRFVRLRPDKTPGEVADE
jgi:bifunctional non-homologous end joining protein LigD